MHLPSIIVALLVAAVLASGCAGTATRHFGNGLQDGTTHANDSHYGVIDSIRSGSPEGDYAREGGEIHAIRIRYDDRSYQTVLQAGLDGLRVGDGVRIEQGRVRPY